jgi:hypothetical protein
MSILISLSFKRAFRKTESILAVWEGYNLDLSEML